MSRQARAKLRELEPKTGFNLYNAACAYSLCAGTAVKTNRRPRRPRKPGRQKFVDLRSPA